MKDSTTVASAYFLLGKGVHFDEIRRFIDADTAVDSTADTIPAPPPTDPDRTPTQRAPFGDLIPETPAPPALRPGRLVPPREDA